MRLRLPPTMRFPLPEEAPAGVDIAALDAARAAACIEPGFRITLRDDAAMFDFQAIVNVHTDDLWRVFEALTCRLPEPTAAIVNERDLPPYLGAYVPTESLLPIFRLFRQELVNDAFIEFGIIHGSPTDTHEVFVTYAKYLVVWGRDVASFRAAMKHLGLPELPQLATINQFPLSILSLNRVIEGAAHHEETLDSLVERLKDLELRVRGYGANGSTGEARCVARRRRCSELPPRSVVRWP